MSSEFSQCTSNIPFQSQNSMDSETSQCIDKDLPPSQQVITSDCSKSSKNNPARKSKSDRTLTPDLLKWILKQPSSKRYLDKFKSLLQFGAKKTPSTLSTTGDEIKPLTEGGDASTSSKVRESCGLGRKKPCKPNTCPSRKKKAKLAAKRRKKKDKPCACLQKKKKKKSSCPKKKKKNPCGSH